MVSQPKNGKDTFFLKEAKSKSVYEIVKFPIFFDFTLEHYFGNTHVGVEQYSYLEPL